MLSTDGASASQRAAAIGDLTRRENETFLAVLALNVTMGALGGSVELGVGSIVGAVFGGLVGAVHGIFVSPSLARKKFTALLAKAWFGASIVAILGILAVWLIQGFDVSPITSERLAAVCVVVVVTQTSFIVWLTMLARRTPDSWIAERASTCAACRYDLSGVRGPVCPECGAAVVTGGEQRTSSDSSGTSIGRGIAAYVAIAGWGALIGAVGGSIVPMFGTIVGGCAGLINGLVVGAFVAPFIVRKPITTILAGAGGWACLAGGIMAALGIIVGWIMPQVVEAIWLYCLLIYLVCTGTFVIVIAVRCAKASNVWPAFPYPTCDRCRYNLSGLESKVCPECGHENAGDAITAAGVPAAAEVR